TVIYCSYKLSGAKGQRALQRVCGTEPGAWTLSLEFRAASSYKETSCKPMLIREQIPGILRAFIVAIPAGFLFAHLRLPIPWMLGPMIAVATLNLSGVRMHSPPYARQIGQVILGCAVSLYFTPTVVAALATNLPAVVAATVAVLIVAVF